MKKYILATLFLLPILLLSSFPGTSWADRDRNLNRDHRHSGNSYVIDRRHEHNQFYPRRGEVFRHLPERHYRVLHHGSRYYFSAGVWYQPYGTGFTVIAPPVGVVIPILPRSYTTVWFGADPYYYADGVYYRWYPQERGYIVVDPPGNTNAYVEPSVPDELFVYPSAGQSQEQLATDRYECHRWAVGESGFDPTHAGGNVAAEEYNERRLNYNRATKACLDAKGYSVQ